MTSYLHFRCWPRNMHPGPRRGVNWFHARPRQSSQASIPGSYYPPSACLYTRGEIEAPLWAQCDTDTQQRVESFRRQAGRSGIQASRNSRRAANWPIVCLHVLDLAFKLLKSPSAGCAWAQTAAPPLSYSKTLHAVSKLQFASFWSPEGHQWLDSQAYWHPVDHHPFQYPPSSVSRRVCECGLKWQF